MKATTDLASRGIDPLSIIHLCAPADVGGLERVVQMLAAGLSRRGHDVSVVAVVDRATRAEPFFAPLRGSTVRTIAIEIPSRGYVREVGRIRTLIRELRPSILHTHGYRSDLLHGASARRLGTATVSTLHGSSRMGGHVQP